jgi:hypothetical protein
MIVIEIQYTVLFLKIRDIYFQNNIATDDSSKTINSMK